MIFLVQCQVSEMSVCCEDISLPLVDRCRITAGDDAKVKIEKLEEFQCGGRRIPIWRPFVFRNRK